MSADKPQSTWLHFALQFFNSLCFQYTPRNKINFWEISICLNFTSLTRNDEKLKNGYTSKYGTCTHIVDVVCINDCLVGMG